MRKLLLVAMLVAFALPASAEQRCGTREAIVNFLAGKYGEVVVATGEVTPQIGYEFWINPDTGTWTVVRVTVDGTACMMASGEKFRLVPRDDEPRGDPA